LSSFNYNLLFLLLKVRVWRSYPQNYLYNIINYMPIIASMIIKRSIKPQIEQSLFNGKIVILYGARQVGKTTLIKEIISSIPDSIYLSCEEPDVRDALTDQTSSKMKAFIGNLKVVVLDEAQRVQNIGLSLKLLHDAYPDLQIIATGSSSFELSNKITEPLTGRNFSFVLYPISYAEYADTIGRIEAKRLIEHRLVFGFYPDIVASAENLENKLRQLAEDYLFKDVLRVDSVRKPIVIEKLARLLALQTGSEVSYNEIAQKLEISRQTVLSYVRLLEQSFIIFRLPPFGRNPRNEITRFEKIFFYDIGMRNALVDNLAPFANRDDKGKLFENFFIVERMKQYQRLERRAKNHFWRTKDGSEVDLVEKDNKTFGAFECKWGGGSIATRAWRNAFPNVPVSLVSEQNFADLLLSNEL